MPKKSKLILGVDVGGSGIKGAPVHIKRGELHEVRKRIPTPKPATPEAVAGVIAELADAYDWTGPIGCCLPSRVRRGVTETAANIDESWIGCKAAKLIARETGLFVSVINDADAAGLAEVTFGAGRKEDGVVLVLTFGTGIGSGLFIDGCLVPNTELGHMPWKDDIAEHFAADSVRKAKSLSWKRWAESRVQPLLDAYEFLFSPDLIILGGGVSRDDRWSEFGHFLTTRAKLKPARLGNNAGIVGAAYAGRKLLKRM